MSDEDIKNMPKVMRSKLVELALGRIFRMGARASKEGDVAEYERCRAIIMAATES